MTQISSGRLRTAKAEDGAQLLRLWTLLFEEVSTTSEEPWKGHARDWFSRYVDDTCNARFPAIEVGGELVATANGTMLVLDVVAWARSIAAGRVDLSATPAGQRIYGRRITNCRRH